MPALLSGRNPHDIAWTNFFNKSAPTLYPAKPGVTIGVAERSG